MTFEEAKKIYQKYDCSLFAMAREEKQHYEDYKKLNIPKLKEEEWRQELVTILTDELKQCGSSNLFSRICNLSENGDRRNIERLYLIKELLNYIEYENLEVNAVISETIMGRKDFSARSGLIFWAYDLGDCKIAKELLIYVMHLLSQQPLEKGLAQRFAKNMEKCRKINLECKLDVF